MPAASTDDSRWFAEHLQPHEPALRAYLERRYPGLSDLDDVVQESFLKTLRARNTREIRSTKNYLFTAAVHTVVSFFRRRKSREAVSINELPSVCVLTDNADLVENICSRDELSVVAEAVSQLPDRCREVVTLRLLQGVDYAIIAQRLGIAEDTVRVQVAKGIHKCRLYLRERGVIGPSKS